MKKIFVVAVAILAVSTSAALAKGKAKKPKAAPAAAMSAGPMMGTAADRAMMMKNKHDSGVK